MANITGFVAINSGDAVLATPVSDNFSEILNGVNSNNLNSENYGQSSILSQHISTNAILSQHISNSQIVSAKISTNAILSQHISDSQVVSAKISQSAIVHNHLNFASASDGARIVQIGAASNSMPANGVVMARLSETFSHASTGVAPKLTLTHQFSDCQEGAPGFTATPLLMGEPLWQLTATLTNIQGPIMVQVVTMDSVSAKIIYQMSRTFSDPFTGTVHMGIVGE